MSFTGDLEHLPIVDVIQLLHSTRKSGTLTVQGNGRQSQLVFSEGYIVSANHSNLSVRIGQILVEMKAITPEDREWALRVQREAGDQRKPLIATLIESGRLSREDAYRGLEILIELTIVEILTWERGTFTLDLDNSVIADEYRYFPEKCHQEINLDTQNILMDALRIYDEKLRDGELADGIFDDEPAPQPTDDTAGQTITAAAERREESEKPVISVEDLGLDILDRIEPRIPEVFATLEDRDEAEEHRQAVTKFLPKLSPADQKRLVDFLTSYANSPDTKTDGAKVDIQRQGVVLFSQDPFTRHTATTACRHTGLMSFSSQSESDLVPILDQSLAKSIMPVLVLDAPDSDTTGFSPEELSDLRQKIRSRYPDVPLIQMGNPGQTMFLLQAIREGATAVLPKPDLSVGTDRFVDEMILFLEAFACLVRRLAAQPSVLAESIREQLSELQGLKDAPDVSYALLRVVRKFFPRTLTMIVSSRGIHVEKCLGFGDRFDSRPSLGFSFPVEERTALAQVIASGNIFFAESENHGLGRLFELVGAPASRRILLLPMKVRGRVVSITYADFGCDEPKPIPANIFEIMASQAGLSLENALLRKQIEKRSA
ncbi:uncharacterized protein DUF4388 [Geothermobacter ehrlichii]|uniref:Uncharacterized protein DUF4388 n=1 Tax=Geothermobacter ehrlichii TaxID=213224 RepID=A0A5D3WMK3_9BACT|nr:response regulator [Geothermobacter ehrlichii]TYO99729.1 uncharacterized protein DUF4388 [Geothermobacter ehrlichii]